jgi:aminopeptidase-like protein
MRVENTLDISGPDFPEERDRGPREAGSLSSSDPEGVGLEMHEFISGLYPICRSITGDGVRQTLGLIGKRIPLKVREVPSGTKVFDWTVPMEWNIRDAYVKDSRGERVVDFRESSLHVVSYSVPVRKRVSLKELREHLFSLPERPGWIPYRHTYYKEDWGFCVSHNHLLELRDDYYEVCIDSSLRDGHLTYGEYLLRGESEEEILISSHICHPSLCNDNLSGIAVAVFLAQRLMKVPRKYSYRLLFVPSTIGSITWLALNEEKLSRIRHGLVLACLGDRGPSTYKRSRRGNDEIDKAAEHVLRWSGRDYEVIDFYPFGYDERQYCSPGINLPVGCLMRTPNGRFPEYHTSADNLDFVLPEALADSLEKCVKIFDLLENNALYVNQNPKGEPQLGRRGLFRPYDPQHGPQADQNAMLWVLNMADGGHSLLDIAERAGMSFEVVSRAAVALARLGLLKTSDHKGE